MLAMALIVVMPAITKLMPGEPGMGATDASCPYHLAAQSEHAGSPHAPSHLMEWCGYCFLLHHSPLLGSGAVIHWVATVLVAHAPSRALTPDSHDPFRLSADPRGPPIQVS